MPFQDGSAEHTHLIQHSRKKPRHRYPQQRADDEAADEQPAGVSSSSIDFRCRHDSFDGCSARLVPIVLREDIALTQPLPVGEGFLRRFHTRTAFFNCRTRFSMAERISKSLGWGESKAGRSGIGTSSMR